MKKIILITIALFAVMFLSAQDYKQLVAEGTHTVEFISEIAERHFDTVGRGRGTGYKPFKRWQYFAERAMDETGKLKSPEFYYNELELYNSVTNQEGLASRTTVGTWEEMGPTYWNATAGWNPGVGRITSMAFEVGNADHIIAGANTGGVWKTVDGGATWTVLTDNLANIDVYALAIDPTNSLNYFWGSTGGSIFKSIDGGSTWNLHATLPNGGQVNKILIHPTDTSKMYCTAQGSGIYRSTDGGASWILIKGGATTGYDVEFKPGDPSTVYASGSNFFRSNDDGVTFTTIDNLQSWTQEYVVGNLDWATSSQNQNASVTPRTGNGMAFFYISNTADTKTMLISQELNLSGSTNPQLKFSYTMPIWFGDQDELKVFYKTSLNGAWIELAHYNSNIESWEDVTLSLPNASATYYIAFEGNAKYGYGLTLDDVSVEDASLGLVFKEGFEGSGSVSFNSGAKMMAVSPNNPNVLFILEASGGAFGALYKSEDSGETFMQIDHAGKNYFGYSSDPEDINDADSGQAPRDMDIAINPNDVNDVHIAGVNTWRSTDGGLTFTPTSQWTPWSSNNQNIGYCHADIDLVEFVGTGANTKLFVGTDGGIFKADNPTVVNSNYYTDLTVGMGIRQFYKIGISQTDPVVVTGGSQDNGTSVMDANGTWTDWLGADGMECFVDKDDSKIMYGTAQFGSMSKTLNGGVTRFGIYAPVSDGNWNWIVPFEQDPLVQNTIYVAYDEVFKSLDGGSNWTSISQNFGSNIDHFKVAPTNSDIMYLSINDEFYYSTNGGGLWTQSTLNGGWINEIAVHPTNPNKIAIATTGNQKVYLSTDNGQTWNSILWDLPNFSAQALVWQNNNQDGLYIGMNYGVYYTDNVIGDSWVPFNNGLPNVRINELEINTVDNKVYAATYGRGLWRSSVYSASLSIDELELNDLVMYPNPAKTKVNLKWSNQENVSVRIYNTLGKLMFYGKKVSLFNGLDIDVSSYNSGMYFVKLNSAKGELTKKLIIE